MSYLYIFIASAILSITGMSSLPHAEIEKAFNANDASAIVNLANEKVLMTVLGKDGAYSKSQAKLILKDFFAKHPKGKFDIIHPGKEGASAFSIGNYTVNSDVFRVTFHFKKVGSNYLIETLNIEK